MSYLRSMGDSDSCRASILEVASDKRGMYTSQLNVPGSKLTARQLDCVINSSDGVIRREFSAGGDTRNVPAIASRLQAFMRSLHPSDVPPALAAMKKWLNKESANKQDRLRPIYEQLKAKYGMSTALSLRPGTATAAQAASGPGGGVVWLGGQSPAAPAASAQSSAAVFSPGGFSPPPGQGLEQVVLAPPLAPPPAMLPATSIASFPSAIGGIPVKYLAIGGVALVGILLLTRKQKG